MKNEIIFKVEKIILIVIAVGILLRLLKIMGGGIVVTISFSSLAMLYFLQAFISFKTWKLSKSISIINAVCYFFLASLVSAILYFIMFWPGGQVLVFQTVKIYFLIIGVGIIYILVKGRQAGTVLFNGVKITFIKFTIFLFIAVVLSVLPNEFLIKAFARDPHSIQERLEHNYK